MGSCLGQDYRHAEGNSAFHPKTSLMGFSVQVLVNGGCVWGPLASTFEFDGPRTRQIWISFSQDKLTSLLQTKA